MNQVEDIYGLAPMQQLMLFDSLFLNESAMYRVQNVYRLSGALDIAVFERAWNEVVSRNPIIRTSFHWDDLDKPMQVVHRDVELPLEQYDWRDVAEGEKEKKLDEFIEQDKRKPVRLERPPLMRLVLIHLGGQRLVFLWSFQHILIEGWSASLILEEVFACYKAYSKGGIPQLTDKPPYRNYINWLQQQDYTKAEMFWKDQLSNFDAMAPLGIDRRPGTANTQLVEYATERIDLSAETTRALYNFAQRHALTMNTLVQSAWALLLSRYTGCDDVMFGVLVSGRSAPVPDIGSIVGLFVNILPMRIQIDKDESLLAFLKQQQLKQLDIQQYDFVSLADIKRWRNACSDAAIFETLFIFENWAGDASLEGLGEFVKLDGRKGGQHGQGYPISMVVVPGEHLTIGLSYDFDRFDEAAIDLMLVHFKNILDGFVAQPEQTLGKLPILDSNEREQILNVWSGSKRNFPEDICAHQLFEARVADRPDADAVVFKEQKYSYRELNSRANQIAHYLKTLGVGPESVVGIMLERSLDMVAVVLAVFKAGGAYVPLDPNYPAERLKYIIDDTQMSVLLTQTHLLSELDALSAQIVCVDTQEAIATMADSNLPVDVGVSNLAYIIHTSGSTGKPKGTMVTHANLANIFQAWQEAYGLGDVSDSHLQMASMSFDVFTGDMTRALCSGGKLIITPRELLLEPEKLYALMQEQKVNIAEFVPVVFRSFIDYLEKTGRTLDFMRVIIVGSDSWYVNEFRHAQTLCGPKTRLVNSYGVTEATIDSTWFEGSTAGLPDGYQVPIGRPFANVEIYILDHYLQLVPASVTGEMWIGGDGLARGYLNHDELTAERFIMHPFNPDPHARLYKTGDLARFMLDGNIELIGRADFQVKVRGFRVETGEIEAVLTSRDDVSTCVVTLRENKLGEKRLVAYFVAAIGAEPSPADLRKTVATALPDYMVPSAYVQLDSLPLTPNGKIDRNALPAPEGERQLSDAYVVPSTDTEIAIAEIWQEVLQVKQAGIHDNFFDLGGHSLLAIKVVSKMQERFPADLTLGKFFQLATIAALASYIDSKTRDNQTGDEDRIEIEI